MFKKLFIITTLLIGICSFASCSDDEKAIVATQTTTGSQIIDETSLCPDNHHPHIIDLGLPSGTKWSCCNVGAESPNSLGSLFAWGEIATKNSYHPDNYTLYDEEKLEKEGKYVYKDLGRSISQTDYDAAYKWLTIVQNGQTYKTCMPTAAQCEELYKNCSFKTAVVNNKHGVLLTSKNGAKLFLPASGFCYGIHIDIINALKLAFSDKTDRLMNEELYAECCAKLERIIGLFAGEDQKDIKVELNEDAILLERYYAPIKYNPTILLQTAKRLYNAIAVEQENLSTALSALQSIEGIAHHPNSHNLSSIAGTLTALNERLSGDYKESNNELSNYLYTLEQYKDSTERQDLLNGIKEMLAEYKGNADIEPDLRYVYDSMVNAEQEVRSLNVLVKLLPTLSAAIKLTQEETLWGYFWDSNGTYMHAGPGGFHFGCNVDGNHANGMTIRPIVVE